MEDEKKGFLHDKDNPITLEECINLLRTDIPKWNTLRASNPEWKPALYYQIEDKDCKKEDLGMRGIDLAGVDLRGVNLATAELWKANLSGANLEGADIHESLLFYANLSYANLREAKMWTIIAPSADFSYANMAWADLENSLIYGSKMNNCDLSNANLLGVHFCDKFANGVDITGSKLHGIQLSAEGDHYFPMLAGTKGLETVDFGDQTFLSKYITKVFDVINQDKKSIFIQNLATKIRSLFPLYFADALTHTFITELSKLSSDLIAYLSKHPKELWRLNSRVFEQLVAEILSSFGWEVSLTCQSKDGGYDIFAISKDNAGLRTSWIVECKRYAATRKVGVDVIRGLYGVKADLRVSNVLLATTSFFTKGVRDFKTSHYDIELRDFEGILDWINSYSPNPDGKLYIENSNKIVLR